MAGKGLVKPCSKCIAMTAILRNIIRLEQVFSVKRLVRFRELPVIEKEAERVTLVSFQSLVNGRPHPRATRQVLEILLNH